MSESLVHRADNLPAMRATPDKFYKLAIVDPQYGINAPKMQMGHNPNRKDMKGGATTAVRLKGRLNQGGGKLKHRLLNTSTIDWDDSPPPAEYFTELFRISVNQIIWGGNYFGLPAHRCFIVWDKMQPWDNFSQCEYAWTSFDSPSKLYRISNTGGANREKKIHPTQKPIELYRRCLKDFAKPGDNILDTHVGSGSSRIAAFLSGFNYTGYEISESYFEAQEKRFSVHRTIQTLF